MLSGVGSAEFLILIGVALLLFGAPALLAFWLGYRAGTKRTSEDSPAEKLGTPAAELPAPQGAAAPEGTDEEETQS